jgi:hypothetical protein
MEERTLEHLLAVVEGDAHDYVPTDAERRLALELIALEREEEEVSAFRRRLHDRLASFANPETEERERDVSIQRLELHRRIDVLRAELAELGWPRFTASKGRTDRAR